MGGSADATGRRVSHESVHIVAAESCGDQLPSEPTIAASKEAEVSAREHPARRWPYQDRVKMAATRGDEPSRIGDARVDWSAGA